MRRLPSNFWLDLNVFLAAFSLLVMFGSFILIVPVGLVAKLVVPAREAELIALPAGYVLGALALAAWWRRYGLSPLHRYPEKERRFRTGHVLMALSNLGLVAALASAWGMHWVARLGSGVAVALLAPMMVAPYLGVLGLVMVLGARGPDPAFADTVVEPGSAGARPATARVAAKPPVGRAASTAVVAFGLLASTLVSFMAVVFAGLSFQGNTRVYGNVVVPVAIACFVLYTTIVLWLQASGRRGAAVKAAWAPLVLLFLVLPALQLIIVGVSALFGK